MQSELRPTGTPHPAEVGWAWSPTGRAEDCSDEEHERFYQILRALVDEFIVEFGLNEEECDAMYVRGDNLNGMYEQHIHYYSGGTKAWDVNALIRVQDCLRTHAPQWRVLIFMKNRNTTRDSIRRTVAVYPYTIRFPPSIERATHSRAVEMMLDSLGY